MANVSVTLLQPVDKYNAGEGVSVPADVAADWAKRGICVYSGSPGAVPSTSASVEASEASAVLTAEPGSTAGESETGGGLPV